MNREQRRQQAKKINTPQKLRDMTDIALRMQRDKLKKEFELEQRERLDIWYTMTAWVLQYKLGLGKKRLPEIMDAILNNIDCFNTKHLKPEDYMEIKRTLEKYGIYGDK